MSQTVTKNNQEENKPEKLNFIGKIKRMFFLDANVSSRRKVYNSLWAIVFSLLIGALFLSFSGENPFGIIVNIFKKGITGDRQRLLYLIVIYGIASIGVGFGFKTGLFNMGVAGQMMLSGIFGILILNFTHKTSPHDPSIVDVTNSGLVFVAMIVGILTGFCLASIAGILKTYLKIHEVVSTILLNWIVVYIGKFFFKKYKELPTPNIYDGSAHLVIDGFWNRTTFIWMGLACLIFISLALFLVLKFTTLGYKIKVNGLNPDSSNYAGVNKHATTILSLGFSGALAGLAGFIYFVIFEGRYEVQEAPLTKGFDTVAIALLGVNSPIGIIFSSTFYSILDNSKAGLKLLYFSNDLIKDGGIDVIIGIIIYVAALSNALSVFQPAGFFWKIIKLYTQKAFKLKRKELNDLPEKRKIYLEKMALLKEEYKKNAPEFKLIKKQIRDLQDEVLLKVRAKGDNALSSKEVEDIFINLANEKYALENKLNELGYFAIKDLKNWYLAEKFQYKNKVKELEKQHIEYFNFWLKDSYENWKKFRKQRSEIIKQRNLEIKALKESQRNV
ncbi:simple sugar transport system permease protein, partial [Metamycoplasma subdolum]